MFKVYRAATITATVLAFSLSMAGCSAATGAVPSPSPSTAKLGEVSSVDELRQAFESAGGDCSAWEQTDQVTNATESGNCSTATVLMTFDSRSKRDDTVSNLQGLTLPGDERVLLIGQNWIINSPEARDVVDVIGGLLRVTTGETPTPEPVAPAPDVTRQEFSGSGDFVQEIGAITNIAAVTFRCDDCSRNTVLKSNGRESLIVNTIGSYSGSHLINMYDNSMTTRFEIQATGAWSLVIDSIYTLPSFQAAANGNGDTAFTMFGSFDAAQITNDGDSNFQVFAYGVDGSPLIVNEIGAYSGVRPMKGPVIVQVISNGAWTITPR